MDSDELYNEIIKVVSQWSAQGERILPNGTRLICPMPQVAPQAWLHVLFAPLTGAEIDRLQKDLHRVLPYDFREFLLRANGLELFSSRISIFGVRRSWDRHSDESCEPFDLVSHNEESDRPSASPSKLIYFSATDGGNTWCFFEMDGDEYRIGKTDRHDFSPIAYWPHFNTWLLDEIKLQEILFDSQGKQI